MLQIQIFIFFPDKPLKPLTHEERKARFKRQSRKNTRCQVALVADYKFYDDIGRSDVRTTVYYMVSKGKMSEGRAIKGMGERSLQKEK